MVYRDIESIVNKYLDENEITLAVYYLRNLPDEVLGDLRDLIWSMDRDGNVHINEVRYFLEDLKKVMENK